MPRHSGRAAGFAPREVACKFRVHDDAVADGLSNQAKEAYAFGVAAAGASCADPAACVPKDAAASCVSDDAFSAGTSCGVASAGASLACFQLLYESRDKRLCLFESREGHLSAVDASKFA